MLNILNNQDGLKTNIQIKNIKDSKVLDVNSVFLDLSDLKSKEQDNSNLFSLNFNIQSYVENVLFNFNGDNSYESLLDNRVYNQEENVFENTEQNLLYIKDGQYGYYDINLCDYNSFFPSVLNLIANNENYDISIHRFSSYEDKDINGVLLSKGLKIFDFNNIIVSDKRFTEIITEIPHNLNDNDFFDVFFNDEKYLTLNVYSKINKYKVIVSEVNNLVSNSTIKKNVLGVNVDYFCKKSELIEDNLYTFNIRNSRTLFNTDTFVVSDTDIETEDQEIFLKIIKKEDNSLFKNNLCGIKTYKEVDRNNVNKVNYSNNNTDFFIQDNDISIIEYNYYNQRETLLVDVQNIFNTTNRINSNYQESYFYKFYYDIKLKNLTSVKIFEGERENGFFDGFNTFYRDTIANSQSSLFEFINNKNIVDIKIDFFVNRQDLYNQYAKGNTYDFIHPELVEEIENINTC